MCRFFYVDLSFLFSICHFPYLPFVIEDQRHPAQFVFRK